MRERVQTDRPKILIFHNVVAPYRHGLFRELAARLRVEVWFGQARSADRQWEVHFEPGYDWRLLGSRSIRLGKELVFTPHLERRLVEADPECIIAVTGRPNVLDLLRLYVWTRRRQKKLIVWVADFSPPTPMSVGAASRAVDILRYWLIRQADGIWSYSQATDAWLQDLHVRGLIVTGTQVLEPTYVRDRAPGDRPFRFLFVGKFDERKGIPLLLEAIRALPGDLKRKAEFHFAGSGPLEHQLRAELPSTTTILHGFLAPEALHQLYARCDVLVLPSFYDPWGFVVNEAMAQGTPAIVSDACGARELAAKAGWVFKSGDAGSLAQALTAAAAAAGSPQMRAKARAAEAAYRAAPAADRLAQHVSRVLYGEAP